MAKQNTMWNVMRMFSMMVLAVFFLSVGSAQEAMASYGAATPGGPVDLCEDFTADIERSLNNGLMYANDHTSKATQTYLAADKVNGVKNARQDVRSLYCLSKIDNVFKIIQAAIGGNIIGAFIYNLIVEKLTEMLESLCNAVYNTIENFNDMLTSSAMNAICLPIPDIVPSFKAKTFEGLSCDGTSLQDMINSQPEPVPDYPFTEIGDIFMNSPIVRDIEDVTKNSSNIIGK